MTTESTQPPSEVAQAQAPVPGQSQGHRRRRRRRKTKSSQAAGQNQNGFNPSGQQPQAGAPNAGQQQAPPTQRPSPPQQQGGQGHGRKKKKSRDRDRDRQPNFQASPGNSINGSNGHGGGKKRKQQKGPRQFVGPMDHSYRAVNGNVDEGPPSTIPFTGNGAGAYYNEAPIQRGTSTPVVAADAPTRIFFFIEDLFFLAKIQEVARKLGVKVEFVKGDKEVVQRILDAPENERATLLVFDLNNAAVKPLTLIAKFKTKLKKSVSIIGFLSHLQGDLKLKATEAGCDTVMPRSAFSQSLPNLLRRYGMEDEEDHYPQPVN